MKILHFADLHLGVESYGHLDPATGLSSRLGDFLAALDQVVDFAIREQVDLVLFCGDAYKSREPTQTQQREFARRIKRLSQAGVPVFILIGNHDLPNAVGRATATEIFDTLEVESVHVSSKPELVRIPTRSGILQVVSLPWLRRSALMNRDEMHNLDFAQINDKLQRILTEIIVVRAAELDPALPAILAAHVWVDGATTGSEKQMSIGQEHVLLKSSVANPAFDYVALGHVHKHQVLAEHPPVVYSGSIERVDFGEEGAEKGFYVVDIGTSEARRCVSYRFHPVDCRRFLTIDVEVTHEDPMSAVLAAIAARSHQVKDAVVRLNVTLPDTVEKQLLDSEIRAALKDAYYATIARNVVRKSRMRMSASAESLSPLDALKAYLKAKEVPAPRAELLNRYAEKMLEE